MHVVVEVVQETPLSADTRLGSVRFAQVAIGDREEFSWWCRRVEPAPTA